LCSHLHRGIPAPKQRLSWLLQFDTRLHVGTSSYHAHVDIGLGHFITIFIAFALAIHQVPFKFASSTKFFQILRTDLSLALFVGHNPNMATAECHTMCIAVGQPSSKVVAKGTMTMIPHVLVEMKVMASPGDGQSTTQTCACHSDEAERSLQTDRVRPDRSAT